MKKLILRSLWYVTPVVLIYVFTICKYNLNVGDLLRMGYVPELNSSYRNQFASFDSLPVRFDELQFLPKKKHYRVLTIGDSFTGQGNRGYKNQLAQKESVLNVSGVSWSPFESLSLLINSDFFEHYQIDYVVLQSVERALPDRIETLDTNKILLFEDLEKKMNALTEEDKRIERQATLEKKAHEHLFFSNQSLKFVWNTMKFFFSSKTELENGIQKVTLNRDLFTVNNRSLLFLKDDLLSVRYNQKKENAEKLNDYLNAFTQKLKEKNSQLIYMTAPDKYDIYQKYIKDKSFPRPLFFENFRELEKQYHYIDTQEILAKRVKAGEKDVYYFDDTHWSPKSAKIIAEEILKITTKKAE